MHALGQFLFFIILYLKIKSHSPIPFAMKCAHTHTQMYRLEIRKIYLCWHHES